MAHMTKQELKRNEMSDLNERLSEWYEKNENYITILLAVILIGILGYKGYQWMHVRKLGKVGNELGMVTKNYNQAMSETDEAKRKELLATAEKEGEQLSQDYPSYYAGRLGLLLAGNSQYYIATLGITKQKESEDAFNKAQAHYQKYITDAGNDLERAVGNLALGQVHENLLFTTKNNKERDAATANYEAAQKMGAGTYIEAEAMMALARLLQAQEGKQNDAKALYEKVAEKRPVKVVTSDKDASKTVDVGAPARGSGKELTEKDLNEIRAFTKISYAEQARKALQALKSAPVAP